MAEMTNEDAKELIVLAIDTLSEIDNGVTAEEGRDVAQRLRALLSDWFPTLAVEHRIVVDRSSELRGILTCVNALKWEAAKRDAMGLTVDGGVLAAMAKQLERGAMRGAVR